LHNIAEVAIDCNDRAVVTGNTLEDEKAGFHWAYGRSDLFGGRIGVEDFASPDKVRHIDLVYARGNPIVCAQFDFLYPDGKRQTAIINGVLYVEIIIAQVPDIPRETSGKLRFVRSEVN